MYKAPAKFDDKFASSGDLPNPIEVISNLQMFSNWIMDVTLDNQYLNVTSEEIKNFFQKNAIPNTDNKEVLSVFFISMIQNIVENKSELWNNLNTVLTNTCISKNFGELRFGINPRGAGGIRIQIIKKSNNKQVYPSIYNLSSGESALLCLFGELIRQADINTRDIHLDDVTGIVLIDEIDKHLHIKLQKDVLPKLLALFPNVQFLVSSHSPFLNMGLAEIIPERSKN